MLFKEICRICVYRKSYFSKRRNTFLFLTLVLFLSGFIFWFIGNKLLKESMNSYHRVGHKMLFIGNTIFSIVSILTVFSVGNLCQVNPVLGPLQLFMYQMFKDIAKFMGLFLGLFAAFTLGVRNLYSYNRSLLLEIRQKENNTDSDKKITSHRFEKYVYSSMD